MAAKTSLRSVLFILLSGFYLSLTGQDNSPGIAVLPLEGNGISNSESLVLTDELRSVLVRTGQYTVVERSNMESILSEQGFQLSGCTSAECAVEAGKLLGVSKMVTGSVGKLGELYNISIRLFDVGTGRIEKTSSQKHEGSVEGLLEVIGNLAHDLASPAEPNSAQMQTSRTTDIITDILPISGHRAGAWIALIQPRTSLISQKGSGFGAGIFYRIPVVTNLIVQPELSYSTAEIEYYEPDDILRFEYFHITALLSYEFRPSGINDFFFGLNAGASMNSILGAEQDYENYVSDLKDETNNSFSLLFGITAGIRLSKIILFLEGRYHSSQATIFKDDTSWEVGKQQGFSFMAGIAF